MILSILISTSFMFDLYYIFIFCFPETDYRYITSLNSLNILLKKVDSEDLRPEFRNIFYLPPIRNITSKTIVQYNAATRW